MTAVFRSIGSMEASMRNFSVPSLTPSTSSGGTPNLVPPLSGIYTNLRPALQLFVEVLALHIWHDLH